MFKSKEEVVKALPKYPKGEVRRKFLKQTNALDFISDIGSNVTMYCGNTIDGKTFKEKLQSVSVILIHRCKPNGESDGIGALGGLSESISKEELALLSPEKKENITDLWDNVEIKEGEIKIISDKRKISLNNIKREVREELGNLGIYSYSLPFEQAILLPFKPQDDDYLVNRWKEGDRVCVVHPHCYIMRISQKTAHDLVSKSDQGIREHDTELSGLQKYPLTEVLFRVGQNPSTDYRYAHEWLSGWFLASHLLKEKEDRQQLTETLNQIPYFNVSCQKMGLNTDLILKSIVQGDFSKEKAIRQIHFNHQKGY